MPDREVVQAVKGGPSEAAIGHDTCPTCGAAVAVIGSDEGTMHFQPVGEARIRADQTQRIVEWLREPGKPWGPYPAAAAALTREFGATTNAE